MATQASDPHGVPLQADMLTPIDAYYPASSGSMLVRQFLLAKTAFGNRLKLGLRTEIAQGYGIVVQGMILARHMFRDLKRNLYDGSDEDQGPNKLIYSWRPTWDCLWLGDRFSGRIERVSPPENKVFVVIVTPNDSITVGTPAGWCVRWTWVDEDPLLKEAPIGWQKRYGEKIFTRQG